MKWLRMALTDTAPFHVALWIRNTLRMNRLVDEALARPVRHSPEGQRILVPVMPWNTTDVPWFSIVCGLLLADAGHAVTFVIDDLPFGDNRTQRRAVLLCLRTVLQRVAPHHTVLSLQQFAKQRRPSEPGADRIHEFAALNALRDLRGEMVVEGRARKTALFDQQLRCAEPAITACLDTNPADAMVLPGGIHASSGVWVAAARARGIRVATFDGGNNGTALWAMDGIACHFADVERLFGRLLAELDADELDFVTATAQREIDARRAGIDTFGAQIKSASNAAGPTEAFVVVALNVPWDTQALDRHVCFSGIDQFIVETVRHVITTSDVHVVVRQHPAERFKATRSSDDYRKLLADAFGAHPQVHFVVPEDPINTYALIERSLATIVHTSTIGIEAVLFGKPTLTGANPYYARLGVVQAAPDIDTYRAMLTQLLRRELPVTSTMRRNAQLAYYLSQCNGWVATPFNTGDFARWSQMRFADIASAPQQRLLVDSIAHDIPISWQNHLIRIAGRRPAQAEAG